jgi:sterol desaturase/sphingolipid hydroxylase (fatty acid hydroxylase superfamily)
MWIPGLMLRPLVSLIPFPVKALFGLILFDLASYWGHRWSHEVPLLWKFHSIHHSSERLDWVSGIRVHPLDGLAGVPALAFLLAAGFTTKVAGVILVAQLTVGIFLHANVRWRLRLLHRVVATPDFHHWHHANEPDALNRNYAPLLPVWDVLFGSYFMPSDRRPAVYGTDDPVPTDMLEQLRYPLRGGPGLGQVIRHPGAEARVFVSAARRVARQVADSTLRRPGPAPT